MGPFYSSVYINVYVFWWKDVIIQECTRRQKVFSFVFLTFILIFLTIGSSRGNYYSKRGFVAN